MLANMGQPVVETTQPEQPRARFRLAIPDFGFARPWLARNRRDLRISKDELLRIFGPDLRDPGRCPAPLTRGEQRQLRDMAKLRQALI